MGSPLLNQVDERKDRDPDHVDEVPVQRGDVDPQRVLWLQAALHVDREQRTEPDDTGGHVGAVEAGQRKEGRAEQVAPDREALVHERREFIRLEAEEGRAHQARHEPPELRAVFPLPPERRIRRPRLVPVLDRRERHHHRDRRHEQHERRDRRDRDVQDRLHRLAGLRIRPHLMGQRTDDVLPLVDQVSGDERREQHALRPDEHPDRDLPVVETRGRVVVLGSVRVGGVRHLRMGDGYWLLVTGYWYWYWYRYWYQYQQPTTNNQ